MINLKQKGIVFDTQSFSVHDGPGIRTIVFLKGCPMTCLWCANPEGQAIQPEIRYHQGECRGCLACVMACPQRSATRVEHPQPRKGFVTFDRAKCLRCEEHTCVEACPNRAIQLVGKEMTVAEVMKIVQRDLPYYRGEGGVTLSGGEPLLQVDFAEEILKACQEEYVNTAVETSLSVPWDNIERVIPYVDLFLCDIKHMDSDKHREFTSLPNTQVLDHIARLTEEKPGQVLIRVPTIPGCNDTKESVTAIAAFAKKHGVDRINLLPYHKLGQVKYEQVGLQYRMPEVNPPAPEHMQELKEAAEEQGVKCIIG